MNARGSNTFTRGKIRVLAGALLSVGVILISACEQHEKKTPVATQDNPSATTSSASSTPKSNAATKPVAQAATPTPPPIERKIEVLEEKWPNGTPKRREEGYYNAKGEFILHGASTLFYESGKKKTEIFYKDNEVHGPRTAWREDGKVHTQGQNYEGKADGTWMQYFADGKPAMEMHYDKGKFQGTFVEYHTSGHKRKQSEWVDGKEVNVRVWDETGRELFVVPETEKKPTGSGGH